MVPHLHAWKVAFVSSPDSGGPPLRNRMFNSQRCCDHGRPWFVSILGDGELDGTRMHVCNKHWPSTFEARTRSVHVPFSTAFRVVATLSEIRRPQIPCLGFSFFLVRSWSAPSSSTSKLATLLPLHPFLSNIRDIGTVLSPSLPPNIRRWRKLDVLLPSTFRFRRMELTTCSHR